MQLDLDFSEPCYDQHPSMLSAASSPQWLRRLAEDVKRGGEQVKRWEAEAKKEPPRESGAREGR